MLFTLQRKNPPPVKWPNTCPGLAHKAEINFFGCLAKSLKVSLNYF